MEDTFDNNLLVCKACGYKIRSRNLKTVCPACGVDKKFFVPFIDNVSPVRRTVLEFHLHPVVVHFSVAISIILLLIILVSFFTGGKVSEALKGTTVVISILLPFFVAAGLVSGIIDGIARFKKVKRPALLNKIYLSIGFLIFSVAVPLVLLFFSLEVLHIKVILLILCFFSATFGTLLGKLGGHLTEAILPGK